MLSINGLHNFYYLPELHDMRCKAQRICEIIRGRYHRDPLNGDVYMFMSKDQRKVRMIHYERNAYYLHEKSFIKGYKFMKIERKDDVTVYKIDWKDLFLKRIVLSYGLFFLSLSCWSCCLTWFRTLSTVFRTSLCTTCHTGCIQSTANDMITYTWKVFHTTTTNQYD